MMLELSGLTAGYGSTPVLHGLCMLVTDGKVHALLGRNGAGKTTALRRIMGIVPAQRGSVTFTGQDISHWSTTKIARAGIGYVPEGREVFATLSVRENLTLAGRIGSGEWNVNRVIALFPNLGTRLNALAGALSGGEQQMLAIGRALMTSPRLLMLDEPAEGLSVQMLHILRNALVELKSAGMTTLLVEQNVSFATAISDRVTLMSRGQVVWDGDAEAFSIAGEPRRQFLGA
ncbi:ABC transporter ATP-binding protein [Paracoccus albus]|uniref:ABC transporter ATP-binding protein n=1 Tax=Paracoccus albus TaxID=3017784 RepID=UPI0022EFE069|nr:ABC transporter ATP-binding protein [Paracoccus albus]WBU60297.1 ABC transporter ATP-binding protein [Paracoccus albus]